MLIELGYPYINGYKPRANYQELLKAEILIRLDQNSTLATVASEAVTAPAPAPTKLEVDKSDLLIVPAPRPEKRPRVYERRKTRTARLGTNYLEIESRNRSLGKAGELFALDQEHRRLWTAGHRKLAEQVEHVSQARGDGLGYDILSFEPNGRERLIEVKTTRFGELTPFFATNNEVELSAERDKEFHLYRVFQFRDDPKLFMLHGSLRETCSLSAATYRASVA